MPTARQIERLVAGARHAARLHADPFVAVEVFAASNPTLVFAQQPLLLTKKKKTFSIGIKSSWSLRNIIRRKEGTLFLDSSWWHKNENKAPLTFVTTTNEAQHMVPGEWTHSSKPNYLQRSYAGTDGHVE